jgi:hypothetical protein
VSPDLVPYLSDVWELIKNAGAIICLVFAYLWKLEREERYKEREERQDAQRALMAMVEIHRKEKEAIADRAVTSIHTVGIAVQGIKDFLMSGTRQ